MTDKTKIKSTFEYAEVGDRVWESCRGFGVIEEIGKTNNTYPLRVRFESSRYMISYTIDGHINLSTIYPSLFWDEHEPYPVTERPTPEVDFTKLPVNTDVQVKDNSLGEWFDRKFLCIVDDEEYSYRVFENHRDSTNARVIDVWRYCRVKPGVEIKREWLK